MLYLMQLNGFQKDQSTVCLYRSVNGCECVLDYVHFFLPQLFVCLPVIGGRCVVQSVCAA